MTKPTRKLQNKIWVIVIPFCSLLLHHTALAVIETSNQNPRFNSIQSILQPKTSPASQTSSYDSMRDMDEQCALRILQPMLSAEGLSVLVEWTARQMGTEPRFLLKTLINLYDREIQKIPEDIKTEDTFNDDVIINNPEESDGLYDVKHLLHLISLPQSSLDSEIRVPTPQGLPRALLILMDSDENVILEKWVDLRPTTTVLDLLKFAKTESEYDTSDSEISLDLKFMRLRSRKCHVVAKLGPLRSSPRQLLQIQIFNYKLEPVWKSPCLPKVSELLIYSGYIVIVSPGQE